MTTEPTVQQLRQKKRTLIASKAETYVKIKNLQNRLKNETDLDFYQVELIMITIKGHQAASRRLDTLYVANEVRLKVLDLDYQENVQSI